jgi:hypothetical protein
MDMPTLQLLKDGFSTFREAIGAVKDAKSLLPAPERDLVAAKIEQADKTAAVAEAQIARALGFQLHDCTFPPQIMLAVQMPHGEEKRCPACGHTTTLNRKLVAPHTVTLGPRFRKR